MTYWLCKSQYIDPHSAIRLKNKKVDDICTGYEYALLNCIECYGFQSNVFNELSEEIMNRKDLKKKVKIQASHYKVAAEMDETAIEGLCVRDSVTTPSNKATLMNLQKYSKYRFNQLNAKNRYMVFRFSKALREVESERIAVRRDLLKQLGIRAFPKDMCNPDVLPAMAKPIQQACSKFPKLASKVILLFLIYLLVFISIRILFSLVHVSTIVLPYIFAYSILLKPTDNREKWYFRA